MFHSAVLYLTLFSLIILKEVSVTQQLTDVDMELAYKIGNEAVMQFKQLEDKLLDKGLSTARHGLMVSAKHGQMTASIEPSSRIKHEASLMRAVRNIATLKHLQEKFKLNLDDTKMLLKTMRSNKTADIGCPAASVQCSELSKFRSISGTCNNVAHPHWGEQSTLFNRLLPPAYSNGISSPRRATNGGELPSPRKVSTTVVGAKDRELNNITLVLMSWGQFITHDITLALGFTYEDGQVPVCCKRNGTHLAQTDLHPFCLPIDIPADDDYLAQFNQECMTFVRSLQADDGADCNLSYAEQVNANTHFLDASVVYGSDGTSAANLRAAGHNGLLKTSTSTTGQELLPVELGCAGTACFYSGDSRATENPQLTVLHTVFVREHNRLARALKLLNPLWTDEILYQEARRIVVATVQHITYTEFLPAFLGDQAMVKYGLKPAPIGSFGNYSTLVNPGVTNEFAAAGFRVGHSLVQGILKLYNAVDVEDQDKSLTLSDFFFDASRLTHPGFIDSALRGLTKQASQLIDSQYTDELTDRLFKNGKPFGLDLVALNIQRGREHGIPDFNTIRGSTYCGLQKAQTFEDLRLWMNTEDVDNLKAVYSDVNDMDMYIAGLVELPFSNGALIGPTTLCLIADQFAKTKSGDRFFYDVGGQHSSFTIEQLDQIRKTSLARIFCDNSDGTIDMMQPRVFHSPQGANARVLCSSIPSIDLSLWK